MSGLAVNPFARFRFVEGDEKAQVVIFAEAPSDAVSRLVSETGGGFKEEDVRAANGQQGHTRGKQQEVSPDFACHVSGFPRGDRGRC